MPLGLTILRLILFGDSYRRFDSFCPPKATAKSMLRLIRTYVHTLAVTLRRTLRFHGDVQPKSPALEGVAPHGGYIKVPLNEKDNFRFV